MAARELRGRWRGRAPWCAMVAGALLVGGVVPAGAELTPKECLARKVRAWGNLRQCQATANGKRLKGKMFDLAKCQSKFEEKIVKLSKEATKAAIACRYESNGDGTVTDYDTGLQWEQKTDDGSVHDRANRYSWSTTSKGATPDGTAFTSFLVALNSGAAGPSLDLSQNALAAGGGTQIRGCFAGHCDWRLPSIFELWKIVDRSDPRCDTRHACIDQTAFGPTGAVANFPLVYWSVTTLADFDSAAYFVVFNGGGLNAANKTDFNYVRAVRAAL
jgi:hypothetical protein